MTGAPTAHAEHTSARLPARLVGTVVSLSPTTADRWARCRRQYLLQNVLQLPAVDDSPWTSEGLKVHDILRQLHEQGTCDDRAWVDEIVASYGGGEPDRLRGFLERHAARCPKGAEAVGHEVGVSRFHREPAPPFLAAASIDAIWIHDGLLDARDYKTGTGGAFDISGDVRARVQAWLLEPMATRRGLRLRLRYEFLAPEASEDPAPWDPEPEELIAIDEELRSIADAMRTEREFVGCREPAVCRTCGYRSICVDAALTQERVEEPPPT